jgi:hypothetical protein
MKRADRVEIGKDVRAWEEHESPSALVATLLGEVEIGLRGVKPLQGSAVREKVRSAIRAGRPVLPADHGPSDAAGSNHRTSSGN